MVLRCARFARESSALFSTLSLGFMRRRGEVEIDRLLCLNCNKSLKKQTHPHELLIQYEGWKMYTFSTVALSFSGKTRWGETTWAQCTTYRHIMVPASLRMCSLTFLYTSQQPRPQCTFPAPPPKPGKSAPGTRLTSQCRITGGCSIFPLSLRDVQLCRITQHFTYNFQEFAPWVNGLFSLWKLIYQS